MNTRILALLVLLPVSMMAAEPGWWSAQGVKSANPASNQSPANLGQAKWFAKKAKAELDSRLSGVGAGVAIDNLVASFTTGTGNFAPINQGQLKAIAKLYYDRLLWVGFDTKASLAGHGASGWAYNYPWTSETNDDSNYSPVNLGQLKWVFSFDLSSFTLDSGDTDNDGLPNWWEALYNTSSNPDYDQDYFNLFVEFNARSSGFDSAASIANWPENTTIKGALTPTAGDDFIVITPSNSYYRVDAAQLTVSTTVKP